MNSRSTVQAVLVCSAFVLLLGGLMLSRVGMIPRGEVTLVFAALGSIIQVGRSPILDDRGYAALVTVVVLTTLMTPPALKWSLGSNAAARGVTKPAA